MGIKKIIIYIILKISNIFVSRFSIKQNQVAFVSLESNHLESDLKIIYDGLKNKKDYNLKTVLINARRRR